MSRYTPINGAGNHNRNPSDRPATLRLSSSVFPSRNLNDNNRNAGRSTFPDSSEMNAAFDMSDDEEEGDMREGRRGLLRNGEHSRSEQQFTLGGDDSDEEEDSSETRPLTTTNHQVGQGGRFDDPLRIEGGNDHPTDNQRTDERMPGSYDFERDFVSCHYRMEDGGINGSLLCQYLVREPNSSLQLLHRLGLHLLLPSSRTGPKIRRQTIRTGSSRLLHQITLGDIPLITRLGWSLSVPCFPLSSVVDPELHKVPRWVADIRESLPISQPDQNCRERPPVKAKLRVRNGSLKWKGKTFHRLMRQLSGMLYRLTGKQRSSCLALLVLSVRCASSKAIPFGLLTFTLRLQEQ